MKASERMVDGTAEPEMIKIREVVEENLETKSIILNKHIDAEAGQFAMLWIPGLDEKPMSFSDVGKRPRFTVKKIGDFSKRLHELGAGDEIGVRGPYGRGFSGEGESVCLVAAGCGASPILPLAKTIKAKEVTIVLAAKTKRDLLFRDEFAQYGELIFVTDDGSEGRKGFATEGLAETLLIKKFDRIYACGREEMLAKIIELAVEHNTECELSTERYMKCGIGLCGQCTLGNKLVCTDGPVFTARDLAGTEFGKHHSDKCGGKVRLND